MEGRESGPKVTLLAASLISAIFTTLSLSFLIHLRVKNALQRRIRWWQTILFRVQSGKEIKWKRNAENWDLRSFTWTITQQLDPKDCVTFTQKTSVKSFGRCLQRAEKSSLQWSIFSFIIAPPFATNRKTQLYNNLVSDSFHITRQIERGRGGRGLYVHGSGIEINSLYVVFPYAFLVGKTG